MKILIGLLAVSCFAQSTTVSGALTVSGSPVTEVVTISWPAANLNTGARREAGHMTVQPANDGTVTVSLIPSSSGVPPFLYTVTGSTYFNQWFVPQSSSTVTVTSVGRGSNGGGSGSGTVAGQTTNVVTVGGADATTVKASGCSVSGGALNEMTCKKFNSTGDATQSGVIDLKAKTSLKYWSAQASDTETVSTVEIQPVTPATSTGMVKRVATRSTGQTVVYADGTDTNATVLQMEWYTPEGSAVFVPRNSNSLYVDQFCTVAGTYNQTCLTNAVASSVDGDTLIFNNAFNFASTVSVSGKKYLRFLGTEGASIRLNNAVNSSIIAFTACHGCIVTGLIIDGNRTNQSSGPSYGLSILNSGGMKITENVFKNNYSDAIYEERNASPGSVGAPGDTFYEAIKISNNQFLSPGGSVMWLNYSSTLYSSNYTVEVTDNYISSAGNPSGTMRNNSLITMKRVVSADIRRNNTVSNFADFLGAQAIVTLDTTSTSLYAWGLSFDLGVPVAYVNGATSANVVSTFPSTFTRRETAFAASCVNGVGSLGSSFSSVASMTISCSDATSPLVIGGVNADATNYLIFQSTGAASPISGTVSYSVTAYLTSGSGNSGLEVGWSCADGGDAFLAPTWNTTTDTLQGSPTLNRLFYAGQVNITTAMFTTAGCSVSTSNAQPLVTLRIRKSASATHSGVMKIVKVDTSWLTGVN